MTKPNPDDYFGDSKGEAKPKGKRSLNPDDYFGPIEPPKPKAEKPPGLIKRGLAAVGSVLTNPSYAAAADGQRLADAKPDGQRLVSTKPDAKPDEPSAPTDWRGVDEVDAGGGTTPVFQSGQNPTAARGSVLDRPAVAAPPDRMPEEGMLTPEFVRGIRGEFGKIPPEKRFDALRELASGNGVKAMAARIILRDAEAENMRADFARQERPGMVDGLERAMAAPRVPIKAVPGNPPEATVNFPETGALAQWVQQRDAAGVASRHGAARAVADDQRSIDALTQRGQAAASDPDAKAFASENPMTSAVASGAANMLRGLDNIVPTVLDFASNLVGAKTSGAKNQSETSAWLERKAQNLMPEAGQQEMGAAWHKGEFGEWLMLNLAANAPQLAPTLVAAFVPGTQGAALGLLGGIAAGNKYADTGNSAAAVASGMVEGFSERLPLKYFERSAKALSTLPPAIRGKTVQAIGKALPIVGKHLTAQAIVGAIEEVVAQIGNNAIDATILEKDNTLLDGVAEAAVIGAFASGGLSLPQGAGAIRRAAQSPEQHIAQAIDQAASQYGLHPKAAATLRDKVAIMDPAAATAYAEKVFAAAERAGLVKKPGGGSAVRQNAKDLAAKAAKDAEAQQGDASGDSVPAGAAASSDTGLADDMDAGAILGTQAEAPQATSGEAPTEGATDGPMTDEPAQPGVEAGAAPPIEGDLTTGDGQPYGTKASARARATRDGGDVVEVLGGWVVRQSQPSNTRGTNAGDINAVSGTGSGPRPGAGGNAQPGSADTSGSGGTVDVVQGELPQPGATGTAGAVVPGADAGNRPAATGPRAGNNALTALQVTFGGKTYPVESVEDAQRKWEAFRDSADGGGAAGVSQIGNGIRVVDGAGRFVARISYNGRVWDTEDDGPSAGPKPLTAGQSVTIDGKPYTVKSAKPKVLVLTDADGKPRTITSDSATWAKVQPAEEKESFAPLPPIQGKDLIGLSHEELDAMHDKAMEHNKAVALAGIRRFFGDEKAGEAGAWSMWKIDRWLTENETDEASDWLQARYINEDIIKEFRAAVTDFDVDDAKALGRSIAVKARNIDSPGFFETPEGATVQNALRHAREQGWNLDDVLSGMRSRAVEWAGEDAPELFRRMFAAAGQPAGDRQADGRQAAGDRQLTSGPRILGKIGRTPNAAETVELRPNKDGTLTPHQGKYAMVDYETGEPVVIPGDSTNEQAIDAIKKSGAMGAKDKWFGVQKEQPDVVQGRAPVAQAQPDQKGTPAGGVEPAGAAAAPAVPAAGSAEVEADGVKPRVRNFSSSGYMLTMGDALAKVKELEADARKRKADAAKAPTAIMRGVDEEAASRALTLARKLREDIKQTVNSYPDARAEYAEARGEAQPASVAVEADGVKQPDRVKVMTRQGQNVYVERADLESDKPRMRHFTSTGKSLGLIVRENLDPTGELRRADAKEAAENPLFDAIGTKDGRVFASEAAAARELSQRGLKDTHEVAPEGNGFIVKRRAPEAAPQPTGGEAAPASAPEAKAQPVAKQAQPQVTRFVTKSDMVGSTVEWQEQQASGDWMRLTTFDTMQQAKDAAASRGYDAEAIPRFVSEFSASAKRFLQAVPEAAPAERTPKAQAVKEALAGDRQPFEHAGLKVYPTKMRRDGAVVDVWAVQLPENKGTDKMLGDTLHTTIDEAKKSAEYEAKRDNDRKEWARKEEADRADSEAKKEANRGKNITERAADFTLNQPNKLPPSAGLGTGTRREAMDKAVEQGRAIRAETVEDTAAKNRDKKAVEAVSKAGYLLGLSNENIPVVKAGLEARARLKADKYPKIEYRVYGGRLAEGPFHTITKIEYDYAVQRQAEQFAAEQDRPTPAPMDAATHKDPGEPAEPVTPAVVREAIKTAAESEGRSRGAMKADALRLIDAAIAKAASDKTDDGSIVIQDPITYRGKKEITAVRKFAGDDDSIMVKAREGADGKWEVTDDSYDGSGTGRKKNTMLGGLVGTPAIAKRQLHDLLMKLQPDGTVTESSFVEIRVPGDGVFKVRNTREALAEFRAKVEASPGFRDRQAPAGLNERATDALDRRSTDAAIANMVDEGDFQAALDFAEAKGVDIGAVKLTKLLRDRLEKWQKDQASAKAVADYEAARAEGKPAPGSLAAAFAEKDAAADDFALGQEPPKPVDKKVAAKDLAGQKDIFGGATPFADPLTLTERQLNSLRGKPITMKAQTEDGQVASWEIDAAEAVQSLRSREATIQQLVRCLS